MHRRHLLTLPLLAALPSSLPFLMGATPARAASHRPSEIRAGVSLARANRMQHRLGLPVRSVQRRLVDAIDAGHLEIALLTAPQLAQARRRMQDRLVVLPGSFEGLTAVTRQVLSAALRTDLAAALA